jgi:hypothetical protein
MVGTLLDIRTYRIAPPHQIELAAGPTRKTYLGISLYLIHAACVRPSGAEKSTDYTDRLFKVPACVRKARAPQGGMVHACRAEPEGYQIALSHGSLYWTTSKRTFATYSPNCWLVDSLCMYIYHASSLLDVLCFVKKDVLCTIKVRINANNDDGLHRERNSETVLLV